MLMLDQILDQRLVRLRVQLIRRIGYSGAISDEILHSFEYGEIICWLGITD
jgi:hypothetical protein